MYKKASIWQKLWNIGKKYLITVQPNITIHLANTIGGTLTLINSVLTSLWMYMIAFFVIPKGVLKKNYTIFALISISKVTRIKGNIALLDGVSYANLNIKEVLSKWLF